MRDALRRRPVRYALGADGALIAAAPPDQEEAASDEGTLYRRLAALYGAHDDLILAAASRYGPLGPLSRLRPSDPDAYVWFFDQELAVVPDKLRELRRWLATGGTERIPARLAPTARMIRGFADFDADTLAFITRRLSGANDEPDLPSPSDARIAELTLAYQAALDLPIETVAAWIADPDAPVSISVRPEARARLAAAAAFLRTLSAADHETAPLGILDPRMLHSLAAEVSPYALGPLFGLSDPETMPAWRTAIDELRLWTSALRDLHFLRRGLRLATTSSLPDLQSFAGLPASVAPRRRPATDAAALTRDLRDLLTLRLRQIGAWPFPAGELAGTFARALWSLWAPITHARPPQRCAWSEGCAEYLPVAAHGNRRYCDAHRASADRLRMRRARRAPVSG